MNRSRKINQNMTPTVFKSTENNNNNKNINNMRLGTGPQEMSAKLAKRAISDKSNAGFGVNNNNNNKIVEVENHQQQQQQQQLNTGTKGTMYNYQNGANSIEINPSMGRAPIASQLHVNDNVKEKFNKWREERNKKQLIDPSKLFVTRRPQNEQPQGNARTLYDQPNFFPTKDININNDINTDGLRNDHKGVVYVACAKHNSKRLEDQENKNNVNGKVSLNDNGIKSHSRIHIDGYDKFSQSGGVLPVELRFQTPLHNDLDQNSQQQQHNSVSQPLTPPPYDQSHLNDDNNNNITNDNDNLELESPLTSPINQKESIQQSQQDIFNPVFQDILKGIIGSEVKMNLEKIKKEQPELTGNSEVPIMITRLHKLENTVQQYGMQNQKLKDNVEQVSINLRAIQNNVDQVKQTGKTGGYVNEEFLKVWVNRFFDEHFSNLKQTLKDQFFKLTDRIDNVEITASTLKNNSNNSNDNNNNNDNNLDNYKNLDNKLNKLEDKLTGFKDNLKGLETRFQNTCQSILDSTCFIYAITTQSKTCIYSDTKCQESIIDTLDKDTRVTLIFPKLVLDNEDICIKVRYLNQKDLNFSEGYALLKHNDDNNFTGFQL